MLGKLDGVAGRRPGAGCEPDVFEEDEFCVDDGPIDGGMRRIVDDLYSAARKLLDRSLKK
jgi:hypothetical protein